MWNPDLFIPLVFTPLVRDSSACYNLVYFWVFVHMLCIYYLIKIISAVELMRQNARASLDHVLPAMVHAYMYLCVILALKGSCHEVL